ncbi:MAG: aminoacyl-tRNA hydrolase [Deltaproteobacteria bacterium]|nr:aminoacyl-tRNA hydrolase [Deltaproteobacteria bacterium]
MKIIVGLGNPGEEYEATRHNIGFLVVERLCGALNGRFKKSRLREEAVITDLGGAKTILVKPLTFMNLSGQAVGEVLRYYRCDPEALLVAHDDLDLDLGRIKFSRGSSSGGHNGIASIIDALGTREFCRLRIGIGRPKAGGGPVDYVLSPFARGERKEVEKVVGVSAEAAMDFLKKGIQAVMNRYNKGSRRAPTE